MKFICQQLSVAMIALLASLFLGDTSANAELSKGYRLNAFAKLTQCLLGNTQEGFLRVRIYRTSKNVYLLYLDGRNGLDFEDTDRRQVKSFQGMDNSFQVDGDFIYLSSVGYGQPGLGGRPISVRSYISISTENSTCKILSCSIEVENTNGDCGSSCKHEECSMEKGPFSAQ